MKFRSSPFAFWQVLLIFTMFSVVNIFTGLPVQAQQDSRNVVLQSSQSFSQLPGRSKRYALIIGVDQYDNAGISRLEGASNDATLLAATLVEYAGFPSDQVILLTDNKPLNRRPTRANIYNALSNLCDEVPKDGLLMVAFAGHGMEDEKQAYLLPSDAQVNGKLPLLQRTTIPVKEITDIIEQAGIAQVMVILDNCRSNPLGGRGDSRNSLTKTFVKEFNFDARNSGVKAFIILYSTSIGQAAYEDKEKNQGYFTWAFVEGLKGAAADSKGEVTLTSLLKYLDEVVPKRTSLDLGKDREQRPSVHIEGYNIAALVLAVKSSTSVKASETPAKPPVTQGKKPSFIAANKSSVSKTPGIRPPSVSPTKENIEPSSSSATTVKTTLDEIEDPSLIGQRNINKSTVSVKYSLDQEVKSGRLLAIGIDNSTKFVDDPVIIEYINRVAQNIILHSDARIPFIIKVVNSDEVNVVALPGGFLYISKGLLLAADNEAEIAGVIAHIIAHIAARHGIEQKSSGQQSSITPKAKVPVEFVKFTSDLENEADMLGVQYAWASGYDPSNLTTFFEKLEEKEKDKSGTVSRLFRTHLLTPDRIDKVRSLVVRFPNRDEYLVNTSEFNKVKNHLLPKTDTQGIASTGISDGPQRPTLKRRKEGEDPFIETSRGNQTQTVAPVDIKLINARVTSLRLFEGGQTSPPYDRRSYTDRFAAFGTRYIYSEITLSFPAPGRPIPFVLTAVYYDASNYVISQQTLNAQIESTWVSSYTDFKAGSENVGWWGAGSYRVDIFTEGKKIASRSFQVYP